MAPSQHAPLSERDVLARRVADRFRRTRLAHYRRSPITRVAMVLASDLLDTLGRTLTSIFIAAAVTGQPDVAGRPALDLLQSVRGPLDAEKLPRATGRELAQRVFKLLISRFGWETAEEVLSELLVKAADGKIRPRNGSTYGEAGALVVTIALNLGRDAKRKERLRRESPLVRRQEDGERDQDVPGTDPERSEIPLSNVEVERLLRDVERIHPRARAIVEGILERDFDQADFARDWGVSQSYVSRLLKRLGPQLKVVVERHLTGSTRVVRGSCGCTFVIRVRRVDVPANYARERCSKSSCLPTVGHVDQVTVG